jgi:hypothetical protein
MKIAILTQPLSKNYGGIIQAYALQQVLIDEGHDVITIDRKKPNASKFDLFLFVLSRTFKTILGKRKAPIFFERCYKIIYGETLRFLSQRMSVSHTITSTQCLKDYFEKQQFDAVIVGSDQVWRIDMSPEIENFFFDFLEGTDIKRLSYAASFGLSKWIMPEDKTTRCRELVQKFNAVSVREKDGVTLCEKHLNTNAHWVCDPTLLLNEEHYRKLLSEHTTKVTGELFYYLLDKGEAKQGLVNKVASQLDLKTFTCYPKRYYLDTMGDDINDYILPPIEQWLNSFANAKVVITDSFHGVIFSIIFKKPFLVFINESRGASRFLSLLKVADFENRIIKDESAILQKVNDPAFFEPITIDEAFITQSREYLQSHLSDK